MDRREMLAAAGTLAVAAMSAPALAAGDEHHHHHTGHPYQGLIEGAAHCLMAGQACLSHCIEVLGEGEKEMAPCAASVSELLAVCEALQQLASQRSRNLKKMSALALDVCRQCEEECRKHAKKHQTCKDCADACAACAEACRKTAV